MSVGVDAARSGTALFAGEDRAAFRVHGRDPGRMLLGITTGSVPAPLMEDPSGVLRGRWAYSAILTPKGRMVSDLRLAPLGTEANAFLMDLPVAGVEAVREHLAKVLPPRFARVEPMEAELSVVVGPGAARALAAVTELPGPALEELAEGDAMATPDGVTVLRTADLDAPLEFAIWSTAGREVDVALREAGAVPGTDADADLLRVRAGRPRFGVDMGPDTLPPEAGIERRAIDGSKGCYTGQEVIVRIRDRGHVNRHLRGLTVAVSGGSTSDAADAGTELYRAEDGKAVGRLTTVVARPDADWVALGYVRREVEPGGEVRVGGVDGPSATVYDLTGEAWRGAAR